MAHDEVSLVIEVVYSPTAGSVDMVTLDLQAGATVGQAIQCSRLTERFPEVAEAPCAVWGRLCERHEQLRDRDRVEVYRPLKVDPKEARRQRYAQHVERHGRRRKASP